MTEYPTTPAPVAHHPLVNSPSGYRILVTGSRHWSDEGSSSVPIHRAIHDAALRLVPDPAIWDVDGWMPRWPMITLVHGAARGVDTIAARCAGHLSMNIEAHPADWDRYGKSAGHRRNAEMVALGADICLAFPLGESRGTRGCMRLARLANIPVVEVAA